MSVAIRLPSRMGTMTLRSTMAMDSSSCSVLLRAAINSRFGALRPWAQSVVAETTRRVATRAGFMGYLRGKCSAIEAGSEAGGKSQAGRPALRYSASPHHVLKGDGQRQSAESFHDLRMLGVKAAHFIYDGRVLALGMGGDLLHLVGRHLIRLLGRDPAATKPGKRGSRARPEGAEQAIEQSRTLIGIRVAEQVGEHLRERRGLIGPEGVGETARHHLRRSGMRDLLVILVRIVRRRGRSAALPGVTLENVLYRVYPIHDLLRNDELLARADFVRVVELLAVGLKDLHVLICIAVELFADLGERIAWLHGVSSATLPAADAGAGGLGARGLGGLVDGDVGDEVGIGRIDHFDLVPNAVLGVFGRGLGAHEELVALHVQVLQTDLVLRHGVLYGLIFLFELLKALIVLCHKSPPADLTAIGN